MWKYLNLLLGSTSCSPIRDLSSAAPRHPPDQISYSGLQRISVGADHAVILLKLDRSKFVQCLDRSPPWNSMCMNMRYMLDDLRLFKSNRGKNSIH